MRKTHRSPFIDQPAKLSLDWNDPLWSRCAVLNIDCFHSRSSDHRPVTDARLFFTPEALHVLFRVQDQYVRSVATKYQDQVSRDSCVELFWQPVEGTGYFNFEFNCGGVMLLYYIEDPKRRGETSFEKFREVSEIHAREIEILTTLPEVNPIEITDPIEWRLAAKIPFRALEPYVGRIDPARHAESRANLYKCGSLTSHPHWASWSDIGEVLNFHQPEKFGSLTVDSARDIP